MAGTVKWFSNGRGYGYIGGEDGKDYFVHFSEIMDTEEDGFRKLQEGQGVTFDPENGDKGLKAVNVHKKTA